MDEATKALLRQAVGITDEDLAKVSPLVEKLISNAPRTTQYKTVAEVTYSQYCFAGIKVGDRIVFGPSSLNLQETTCPLCPRALIPVLAALQQRWERTMQLIDQSAEGAGQSDDSALAAIAECLDPGLEHGGLGHVTFKLYSEKIA